MKIIRNSFFLVACTVAAAQASDISIVFDQPGQGGNPGDTISFFGTIYNNGPDTLFFNEDSFDLALGSMSYSLNDDFFANVPLSLDSGANSGDIDLFDVVLNNPVVDPPGTYGGSYTLQGGLDGNAQDNLAIADFTVTTPASAPEPSGAELALAGVLLMVIPAVRRRRPRT